MTGEGRGWFLRHLSPGEMCVAQAACSTQLLSSESHHSAMVRPSGLFFGDVSSLHALPLLGVQPTWLLGGQNQAELSSTRSHGRCPHPPCVLQQATCDSRHLGPASLGTSRRSACASCCLSASPVPSVLGGQFGCWVSSQTLMFFLPGPVPNADEVWNRAARW